MTETDCAAAVEDGITAVTYSAGSTYFPWQVFCTGERCVLVSQDASRHVLIRSVITEDDEPHRVPLDDVPGPVLEAIRTELKSVASNPDRRFGEMPPKGR